MADGCLTKKLPQQFLGLFTGGLHGGGDYGQRAAPLLRRQSAPRPQPGGRKDRRRDDLLASVPGGALGSNELVVDSAQCMVRGCAAVYSRKSHAHINLHTKHDSET